MRANRSSRAMSLVALSLALVALSFTASPVALAAPAACSFDGGFKALHDAIPDIVGDCGPPPETSPDGDVAQATTHGYLVWHHAYNRNTFDTVSGPLRYSDGPYGIQARPANYRFDWEPAPPAAPEYAPLGEKVPYALVPPADLEPLASLKISGIDAQDGSYRIGFDPADASYTSAVDISGWSGKTESSVEFLPDCHSSIYCTTPPDSKWEGTYEYFGGLHVGASDASVLHRECCGRERWSVEWYDAKRDATYSIELEADVLFPDAHGYSVENLHYAEALAALAEQLVPVT